MRGERGNAVRSQDCGAPGYKGIARQDKQKSELTAIIEDELDRGDESTAFALDTLKGSKIKIATVSMIPEIAKEARRELHI